MRKKCRIGAVAALVLVTAASVSPRAALEGRVSDWTLGRALPGVQVTLPMTGAVAVTDENGRFSFGSVSIAASDTLVIAHPEYTPVRIPLGSMGPLDWTLDISIMRAPAAVVRPVRE